ncbi:protein FAR1-RELATED SEQUENCE 11-like [Lotus japonicus]|uniref:protein FAR1-RELATED SEQUENCE 11-like n=1 Tax=Lotus japonicus TaxID=34305 RepID=UPI0025873A2B|nr:protein FAR1-RELATED SEQUENCE 11-like [Lotus japonicus]
MFDSDLSENEKHFKNVYEGVPKKIDGDGDDDDGKSAEDVSDTDSDSANEKYKAIPDLTADQIRGLKFCSSLDALKFYSSYTKSYGFVVRKYEVRRDERKNVVMRQYVCNKAGLRESKYFTMVRKRSHRPLTRTKCQARLRIRLDYRTSEWKVVSFVEKHNHEVTPSKYMHVIPAYRILSESDKA